MNKNSFGKIVATIGLSSLTLAGCHRDQEDSSNNYKSLMEAEVTRSEIEKKDSILHILDDHAAKLEKLFHDGYSITELQKKGVDTLQGTIGSKNIRGTIMTPQDAQKVYMFLKEKGNVTLDIEGFGKVTFFNAKREHTFFVDKAPPHRWLFDVGMDGMVCGSSFDGSQYGKYAEITQDMQFITQAFLDHMNQ